MKFIEPFYFFASFFIAMIFVYMMEPEQEILIKYPMPDAETIYKDHTDMCYQYKPETVMCPSDKSKIKKINVQYSNNVAKNFL